MFLNQTQPATGKAILIVTALSLLILFRGVWASDQNVHQASQSLSLIEFAEDHGHFHDSSLDHLHLYSVEMTDWDHQLLHLLGAFENHVPLNIAAVPTPPGRDTPELQRPPSPLPEQTSLLYRPPQSLTPLEVLALYRRSHVLYP
ncbi:MAG: hypothetical protein KBT73_12675 [Marinobacter sp.]|nr:hypothetical protein [Marinobacter sp.]